MVDKSQRKQIAGAAKSLATYLLKQPVLSTLITSTLAQWKVPATDETKALMLEETAHQLNRMVNGQ